MKTTSEPRMPTLPTGDAWHAGERALQQRVGVGDLMARVGRQVIRDAMPDAHRAFFAKLPFVVLGALDGEGRPWAEWLAGPRGFVSSSDARTLRIDHSPPALGPLAGQLRPGAMVGLLGIELSSRRRNRANGVLADVGADHLTMGVRQSFGNCPQYIQVRHLREGAEARDAIPWLPEAPSLSATAVALVRRADTFFIATATPDAKGTPAARSSGVDVSHRGGKPGFVRVAEDNGAAVLAWPDFAGNSFFNTLGNLALDPHAGLLFADFASGDALALSGRAEVLWEGSELEAFRGAERLVRFRTERAWIARGALSLRDAEPPELAPQLEDTGSWDEVARQP